VWWASDSGTLGVNNTVPCLSTRSNPLPLPCGGWDQSRYKSSIIILLCSHLCPRIRIPWLQIDTFVNGCSHILKVYKLLDKIVHSKNTHVLKAIVTFYFLQCTRSVHFRRWLLLVAAFQLQNFLTNSAEVQKIQNNLGVDANSICLPTKIYRKLFQWD